MSLLALFVGSVVAGCGGADDTIGGRNEASASSGGETRATLALVAYSTPQVVYDEVIPQFLATAAGRGVEFKTSFGASGDQSRAVQSGLEADVVSFSIEPDLTRLVEADLLEEDWKRSRPNGSLVSTSVVSFIVREGNPKDIRTWDDLLEPGVEVITPNPFTSGAAKWNLLGAYAHGGLGFVEQLIKEHVEVQPKSGREALQAFTGGQGDVLLSYEYEAITARRKGEELDYVVPNDSIRIDIPITTTKDAPPEAQQFVEHALSAPAQEIFAAWGYRPVHEEVLAAHASRFPEPDGLKTIDDLGGWEKVNVELFDVETGSIAKIEEEAGVSTAK